MDETLDHRLPSHRAEPQSQMELTVFVHCVRAALKPFSELKVLHGESEPRSQCEGFWVIFCYRERQTKGQAQDRRRGKQTKSFLRCCFTDGRDDDDSKYMKTNVLLLLNNPSDCDWPFCIIYIFMRKLEGCSFTSFNWL